MAQVSKGPGFIDISAKGRISRWFPREVMLNVIDQYDGTELLSARVRIRGARQSDWYVAAS